MISSESRIFMKPLLQPPAIKAETPLRGKQQNRSSELLCCLWRWSLLKRNMKTLIQKYAEPKTKKPNRKVCVFDYSLEKNSRVSADPLWLQSEYHSNCELFIHSFISWILTLCLFAETLSTTIVAHKHVIYWICGYYMADYDRRSAANALSVRNTESVCVCESESKESMCYLRKWCNYSFRIQ